MPANWSPSDVVPARQTTLASFLGGYNEAAAVRDRVLVQRFDENNLNDNKPLSPASKRLRTVQAEAEARAAREDRGAEELRNASRPEVRIPRVERLEVLVS